jgi:hypothetical protein
MDKKVTIFFYKKDMDNDECETLRAMESVAAPDQIQVCASVGDLSAKLRTSSYDSAIAVLSPSNVTDLNEIVDARSILGDIRTILILPDREHDTIKMGHSLRPRFIGYGDGDHRETATVLGKMLGSAATQRKA